MFYKFWGCESIVFEVIFWRYWNRVLWYRPWFCDWQPGFIIFTIYLYTRCSAERLETDRIWHDKRTCRQTICRDATLRYTFISVLVLTSIHTARTLTAPSARLLTARTKTSTRTTCDLNTENDTLIIVKLKSHHDHRRYCVKWWICSCRDLNTQSLILSKC